MGRASALQEEGKGIVAPILHVGQVSRPVIVSRRDQYYWSRKKIHFPYT